MAAAQTLSEYRCACGKLLFRGILVQGVVEVKCRKCHAVAQWRGGMSDGK